MVLARPFLKDPLAVQAKLCRRMERFIKELFVFVSDPAVPSDNNAAERSLRHLVTSRKISGGTRSGQGTDSKMTLASLFGTWRARGLNPLLECRRLLASLKSEHLRRRSPGRHSPGTGDPLPVALVAPTLLPASSQPPFVTSCNSLGIPQVRLLFRPAS